MSEEWVRLDDFENILLPKVPENGAEPIEDSWQPLNLAELDEQPPTRPELGNVGIVYPGKRHVFSGPQESAKTLIAYAIGIQVLRHHQGTLILIDFEMGRYDARNRLRELGATHAELGRILYIEPHEPATTETTGQLLRHDPQLVIIDAAAGAYDLQGLDDNKRQDVERFTRLYIRAFWRANIATIVLDHVVKNTETRGRYAIGSERKIGGADVHLGFDAITPIQRGQTGLYKIVTHKDRGGFLQRGKLADITLESDPDSHAITWELRPAERIEEGEIWMPTALMTKVSIYLSLLHEPVSRSRILEDVPGKNPPLRKAIDHLVRLGYVSESDGAHGAKLITHERLFHENDLPKPPPSDLVTTPLPPSDVTGSAHLVTRSYPPTGGDVGHGADVEPPNPLDLVTVTTWLDDLRPDELEDYTPDHAGHSQDPPPPDETLAPEEPQ